MSTVEARLNSKTPDELIGLRRVLVVQAEKVILGEERRTGANLNLFRAIAGNMSISKVSPLDMNRMYARSLDHKFTKRTFVMGKLALRINIAISRKIRAGEITMTEVIEQADRLEQARR